MSLSVSISTSVVLSVANNEEVDNTWGEVQGLVGFAVDDGDAVSVPVTGPRHPSAKDKEWGTGKREQKTLFWIRMCLLDDKFPLDLPELSKYFDEKEETIKQHEMKGQYDKMG